MIYNQQKNESYAVFDVFEYNERECIKHAVNKSNISYLKSVLKVTTMKK